MSAAEDYAVAVRAAEDEYTAAYEAAKAVRDEAVSAAEQGLEDAVAPARAVRDAAVQLALAEYEQAEGIVREDAAPVVEATPVVDGDAGTGGEA